VIITVFVVIMVLVMVMVMLVVVTVVIVLVFVVVVIVSVMVCWSDGSPGSAMIVLVFVMVVKLFMRVFVALGSNYRYCTSGFVIPVKLMQCCLNLMQLEGARSVEIVAAPTLTLYEPVQEALVRCVS